jgi:hypothetical protein
MAKEENSALKEFWKLGAEFKEKGLLNKKPRPDARMGYQCRRLDNGRLEVTIDVPYEYIERLKSIVAGEKKYAPRFLPPDPDLVGRALLGEFEPLIGRFERGEKLTDKERRTLAKIARGELPRIGRPPETETERRNRDIVRFAQTLKLNGGKRVADVAARKFGIDRSYIPKLIKKYRNEGWSVVVMGALLNCLGADDNTLRQVVFASVGINEDDFREATGPKPKVRK